MNCKTCNKLSCLDCVAELEKQLAQAVEEADKEVRKYKKALELATQLIECDDCPVSKCGCDVDNCVKAMVDYFFQQAEAQPKGEKENG